MTTIFLLVLFVMQIIGFYFLVLLYTKVSKFDDLEKKQRKLMAEMDDSIVAYLSELKDENDRLIESFTTKETKRLVKESSEETFLPPSGAVKESPPAIRLKAPTRPINLALKSYSEASLHGVKAEENEIDNRTKVLRLHDAGQSIEEIAKELGKGRTEVELILKFR